jgi:hypothetical protein
MNYKLKKTKKATGRSSSHFPNDISQLRCCGAPSNIERKEQILNPTEFYKLGPFKYLDSVRKKG